MGSFSIVESNKICFENSQVRFYGCYRRDANICVDGKGRNKDLDWAHFSVGLGWIVIELVDLRRGKVIGVDLRGREEDFLPLKRFSHEIELDIHDIGIIDRDVFRDCHASQDAGS